MTTVKKVAVAGAAGLMGASILDALLQNNFDVTVLIRQDSKATFPSPVHVTHVDYTSKKTPVSALRGQHAVISALPNIALATSEAVLIDASVEAGVRRFIPSNFGSDSSDPKAAALPLNGPKIASRQRLAAIVTGPLLGWVASEAFINPKAKTARLYDGGRRVFDVVTRATVGRAVVAVLSRPTEQTANRSVAVYDAVVTLEKLLSLVQNVVGEEGWTVTTPGVEETLANASAGVKAGRFDFPTIFSFIVAASQGEGCDGLLEATDNELLGIPVMTDDQVKELVEKVAASVDDRSLW